MKRILAIFALASLVVFAPPSQASSDATTITSIPTIANIPQVGNIWSGNIPTSVEYEKSSIYPCGYVIIPITGLLPYATLADKANGVSLTMTAWSDAGAKVGTGYLSSSDWNPVGPITQTKIFFCAADVLGTHTLLIETIYYTSTTGLLSRYISTTNKSRLSVSLQKSPPTPVKDFLVSLKGQQIDFSWSAPSSDAAITGYEIGLFDTNTNAPLPPLDSDLKSPVIISTQSSSSRQASILWTDISKSTTYPGTSIVLKVRALSLSGSAIWSNGIYLTRQQFADFIPASSLPPKPNFSVSVLPPDGSVISIMISPNDISEYVGSYKVNAWVTKLRRVGGQDQIGSIGTINSLAGRLASWTNSSVGSYEVAVALINNLGQGEWSDYKLVVVPSKIVESSPSPVASPVATVKKRTITCVKGKLIKKVTAVKPLCPAGYKLKK